MQLEEKRLKIEESKNSIRVFIDIESHYRVVDGGILEDNLRPCKIITSLSIFFFFFFKKK